MDYIAGSAFIVRSSLRFSASIKSRATNTDPYFNLSSELRPSLRDDIKNQDPP